MNPKNFENAWLGPGFGNKSSLSEQLLPLSCSGSGTLSVSPWLTVSLVCLEAQAEAHRDCQPQADFPQAAARAAASLRLVLIAVNNSPACPLGRALQAALPVPTSNK